MVAYRILVAAQGPLVLGFGANGLGPGLDNMSFKKISSNGPPPELVESDQEDDDEPDLLTTDTPDIEYDFTRTG